MLRRNWKHWYKPNFWVWWWHRDDHTDLRRTLAVLAALALLAAGFGALQIGFGAYIARNHGG